MPLERLKPSFTFDKELIQQLEQLVPECFEDGKINWELLKESLGEFLKDESPETEHFGLNWPGKKEARKMAFTPSKGNLVPLTGEGIDEEKTRNIFIEGENLEVLKLLQKSYAGRIKMIYIDPPYNRGRDIIYEDNFTEPLEEYLRRTGQLDEQGKPLTTNTKADGRFHSKWLSMMYPRLRLARNLLRDDGVIFISIDDNEVCNLRKLCDEIFGEENQIGLITNVNNPKGRSDDKYIAMAHEYLLVYAKNKVETIWGGFEPEDKIIVRYNKYEGTRKYREIDLRKTGDEDLKEDRPEMFYYFYYNKETMEITASKEQIKHMSSIEIIPIREDEKLGRWRWGFDTAKDNLNKLLCRYMPNRKIWGIFEKDYLDDRSLLKPVSTWQFKDVNSERGSEQFIELGFDKEIFLKPKPVGTIKRCLLLSSSDSDIILDFFSGSATTAHAVIDLNKQDNGNRKFIMVQLPELTYEIKDGIKIAKEDSKEAFKAGFQTIAEIGKERIRRVIKKLKVEQEGVLDLDNAEAQDRGFKVFKLEKSNYKLWNNYEGTDIKELESQYDLFESPLVDDWKEESLLTEILLCEGFPLDSKIEKVDNKENKLVRVSSDFCEHKLLICLDNKVEAITIENLELKDDEIFICLDNAINDLQKIILTDKGVIKTI